MNRIDFTSLRKAIGTLAKALEAAKLRPKDEFVRDASIQRFEYTYELCVKSLRHQLTACPTRFPKSMRWATAT